jgi:hypothetical protein
MVGRSRSADVDRREGRPLDDGEYAMMQALQRDEPKAATAPHRKRVKAYKVVR